MPWDIFNEGCCDDEAERLGLRRLVGNLVLKSLASDPVIKKKKVCDKVIITSKIQIEDRILLLTNAAKRRENGAQ